MDMGLMFALAPVLAKHPSLVKAFSDNLPEGEKFINEVSELLNKPEYQALFKVFQDDTPEAQQFIDEVEAVLQKHFSQTKGA
jgi:hypothetical protein